MENFFIDGDNFDVFKLFQELYLGKVKFIYIDLLYNIGNDFVYDDDFVDIVDGYFMKLGQCDEDGI